MLAADLDVQMSPTATPCRARAEPAHLQIVEAGSKTKEESMKRRAAGIHLIEDVDESPEPARGTQRRSGECSVGVDIAEQLIGQPIYLHRKKEAVSPEGGTIISYRLENDLRVTFFFRRRPDHRCAVATRDGWCADVKISAIPVFRAARQKWVHDGGPARVSYFINVIQRQKLHLPAREWAWRVLPPLEGAGTCNVLC